jgi:Chaperone of endosialidase
MHVNNPSSTEIKKRMTTLYLKKSMAQPPLRLALFLIPLVFACFALSPTAQAVHPAPDGGYAGGNTAEGQNALFSLTSGGFNTAVGFFSLRTDTAGNFNTAIGAGTLLLNTADENTATGTAALLSNTTGTDNTANGAFALFSNTSGGFNTATGDSALYSNTIGAQNTATGISALTSNTSGSSNTANGAYALVNNTTGYENTANGMFALFSNTDGFFNTANGSQALYSNTNGTANTANGSQALLNNNTDFNTADGFQALYSNTTGQSNAATGARALLRSTTGDGNVGNGFEALSSNTTGVDNTAIGYRTLYLNDSGNNNTALGAVTGGGVTTASNVTCIGANVPGADVSNTTWIANVFSVAPQSGTSLQVIVSDSGQLGTLASAERFKKDIAAMEKASEAILSLRPVTFHYKTDTKGTPQFGLIAEEVANVSPALVLLDKEGKPYTVRYDQVNAMLLNEFLKEHRNVESLKNDFQATVAQQQKEIIALTATVKEQALQIQKVSAQLAAASPSGGGLEASKFATVRIRRGGPAPEVVNNP